MGAEYEDQDLVVCQINEPPDPPQTISYQFGKAARAAYLWAAPLIL